MDRSETNRALQLGKHFDHLAFRGPGRGFERGALDTFVWPPDRGPPRLTTMGASAQTLRLVGPRGDYGDYASGMDNAGHPGDAVQCK